jgi:hypothetical protein
MKLALRLPMWIAIGLTFGLVIGLLLAHLAIWGAVSIVLLVVVMRWLARRTH